MLTNKKLKYWYRRYNKKYWKNRLPEIPVRFANIGAWGYTHFEGSEPCLIQICKTARTFERTCRFTLLHEQVHVFLHPKIVHGPKFDREMLRLARAGAFKGLW